MRRGYRWTVGLMVGLVALAVAPLGAVDLATCNGKPTFKEGNDFGYYVWRDGDTWKVRWTTFGGRHHFTGAVRAEGGDIVDLKRIDVDTERRVIAPGRPPRVVRGPRGGARVVGGRPAVVAGRAEDHVEHDGPAAIRFSAMTDDDIDGFDFKVRGPVDTLRFNLEIDRASRAGQVSIGRTNHHPAENPFLVRLR